MRVAVALLVSLSLFVSSTAAKAQLLHDQWFKVVVSCDGTGENPETSEAEKLKIKPVVRYAHFVLNEGGSSPSYTLACYAPTVDDTWVPFGGGEVQMVDDAETFASNAVFASSTIDLPSEEGAPNIMEITFNGPVTIKIKNEEFKSAKIKSLGTIAYFTNDTFVFYGKAKVTMTRVPVEKLPFEPIAMVESGTSTPVTERQVAQAPAPTR